MLTSLVKAAKRRPFHEWSAGDIAVWLEMGIGMGQYATRVFSILSHQTAPGAYVVTLDERGIATLVRAV